MKIMKFEISTAAMVHASIALGVAAAVVAFPHLAHAAPGFFTGPSQTPPQGVKNLVAETTSNISQVLPAFSAAAYLGGTIFAVSTLLDAKKYSEDPAGFKGGIPKIVTKGAVAAGLFSLPSVIATVGGSFFTASGTNQYEQLNTCLTNGTEGNCQ